uniref:CCDC144C-like coiled-coil domain-containing protein n=1 Tax=Gorilla gorilla gorilla TaxID=9595 RepID=G3QH92_GORGO
MKLLGFGSRRGQRAQGSIDHVYTGSGYRIRDSELQKIHRAAVKGDAAEVERCLARRSGDLDALDKQHRTALHLACASGRVQVVTLLVSRKCQIDICDKENRTPLIQAVHCQEEACAVILLEHGAHPNLKDIYGNTALHYAVYSESTSLAEKLLSHGAHIEALDKDNNTPLLFAIICKKEKMVEFLLKKKASTHAVDRLRRNQLAHFRCVFLLSSIFHELRVDSLPASDDKDLSVATKQCVPEKVSEPLPGPSHEKGNRIVNVQGEGPPAKHPSLKPSTEVEDPAVKGAVQRKNVQTFRAEQALPVASEEEQERHERSEKKQPQVKEGNNTNKSEKIQLPENICDSTSSAAAGRLTQQRKIGKMYPQQFPKKLKEEHDRCTLKQENEEKTNVNMLYKKNREELERKEKQYKKEVEAKQLEPTVQSLEMKSKTARSTPNRDFHNHEEMKGLMDENCILKADIAILRQEICTMKNDNLEKENKYLKDIKIVKETNAALEKYIKLNEEMITETAFQYQQELNDLKAENTSLNAKLLKEKESKKRLEADIESYQSRLAAAISKHSESVKTERNLKLALERTQDVSVQVEMSSAISKVKDENEFLTEQLSETQVKFNALKDKFRKTRDILRKKSLALETVQNDLSQTQQQIQEMKEMYQNAEAKVNNSTGKCNCVEERICHLQCENAWLVQQLDDVHQKEDHKEIVTNIQRGFIESGKKDLVLEEKSKKLMNECDHLKESLFQYEREKAEEVVSIKEDKYFQTSRKKI